MRWAVHAVAYLVRLPDIRCQQLDRVSFSSTAQFHLGNVQQKMLLENQKGAGTALFGGLRKHRAATEQLLMKSSKVPQNKKAQRALP